jgi:hypothetical protein
MEELEFLFDKDQLLRMSHLFGVAVGVGTATVTDILFFKFMRDSKMSKWEARIMNSLSPVVWAALAILAVSGAVMFLQDTERLLQSSKFLTKMLIVAILILNGAILNMVVGPRLHKISMPGSIRKLAFALGAVSLTSWYSAFLLGMLRNVPLGLPVLLTAYAFFLLVAIIGSQVMQRTQLH